MRMVHAHRVDYFWPEIIELSEGLHGLAKRPPFEARVDVDNFAASVVGEALEHVRACTVRTGVVTKHPGLSR